MVVKKKKLYVNQHGQRQHQLIVHIPKALFVEAQQYATGKGLTMATVIRAALAEHLPMVATPIKEDQDGGQ